jgi:hypothetical protein
MTIRSYVCDGFPRTMKDLSTGRVARGVVGIKDNHIEINE